MTLEQYSYFAEIIGVVLVIASLIYLAQEVNQNTGMMRAEARNQIVSEHQQELFALVQNPDIWRGYTDEELDDERIRLNMWLTAFVRAREHEWFQVRHGALDEGSWRSYSSAIPIVFAGDRARAWWKLMEPAFDKEFVERVNELLENETLNTINKQQADVLR